ncbi:MAG: VWA domain-containing protein [Syntrophales bacterium]|nr:VWA domain-containing protein [Syntrophales bacterium]
MDRVLSDFIVSLRHAGVRISISETLDALQSVRLVGYNDRETLRDALLAALPKSAPEKEIFARCFDHFFSFDYFADADATAGPDSATVRAATDFSLPRTLLSGDQAALVMAMREAARAANLMDIRFFTQRSLYTLRILDRMGLPALDAQIQAMQADGSPGAAQQASALEKARTFLVDNVRRYVAQQLTLNTPTATQNLLTSYLRHAKLSMLEQQHFQDMHSIIQRMVKRLNDLHSRRRKASRRGQLDFKKTLRKNITYQGFLFDPKWKKRKIERPDLVVICDISRSVMRTVRFLLLFLYGLNKAIVRIRTFIFCSNLIEITSIFDEYPVEVAVEKIRLGADLPILMGRTDYDQSFRDFKANHLDSVSRKTTVLILGDARNNYAEAQTGILKMIYERSKRLIWLNPEPPPFWGTGDSEMKKYIPFCSMVKECNTLHHLEGVVTSLVHHRH